MSPTNFAIILLTSLVLKNLIKILRWSINHVITWKNIKSAYNNNKFKISPPTWNGEFDLPDRSYSVSDIQDYFEYIIKKYKTVAESSTTKIYINRIENRVVFKIKSGYKLELLPKKQ